MPFIYYALLAITTAGTAVLVADKAIENTTDAASNGLNKFIVPSAAALGLYAAYKIISKKS